MNWRRVRALIFSNPDPDVVYRSPYHKNDAEEQVAGLLYWLVLAAAVGGLAILAFLVGALLGMT